jgi:hypothetical protein
MHHHILLLKNQGFKYLKYNILSTLFFAVIYWLSDYLLTLYPKFSKKFHLGHYADNNPVDPFYYWLWQSALTQTTVGYGGITSATGKPISILNFDNNIYKAFNFMQMVSVFYLAAIFM